MGPQGPAGDAGAPGPQGDAGLDGLSPWFTEPEVELMITRLDVTASSASVEFTLDDRPGDGGAPLDVSGRLTQGAVALWFALAQQGVTPGGAPGQLSAYTITAVDGGVQATTEWAPANLAVVDVRQGRYRYTFDTPLTGFDPALAQAVLAVARREREGQARAARDLAFTSDAGLREVVEGARCATCHGKFSAHDGAYDSVRQCAVCHTEQSLEPDTGNALDFRVMVHKLHAGAALPSVLAGGTYSLIGATGARDYSTVRYPQSLRRCEACHGGAQADAWQQRPSIATCTSCHDDVVFIDPPPPGTVRHGYGVTPATQCNVCHGATTGVAPVISAHLDPNLDQAHRLELELLPMATVAGGTSPSFDFVVRYDGQPRDIVTAPLNVLRATLAGPNTDFTTYWTVGTSTNPWAQATMQGTGASGTLAAVDANNGVFRYTFPSTIMVPLGASGSFTVGLEAAVNATAPRYLVRGPTRAFAVTDPSATPRRSIIDGAKCDGCHFDLTHHGQRRGAEYCVLCHNPQNANNDRIARFEGTTVWAESLDFKVMIHKIHAGTSLTTPYVLGGNPTPTTSNPLGTPLDFGRTRFPRPLTDCGACHLPGTTVLSGLPGRAPSILQQLSCLEDPAADTDAYCTNPWWSVTQTTSLPPETAVCTSCHDRPSARAHALLNTTTTGEEACASCHGPGRAFDAHVQ